MSLPSITIQTTDNASGVGSNGINDIFAYVGIATSGTANTVYSFSTIKSLLETLGGGPVVECSAFALQESSSPIFVVPTTCDVSSTNSAVSNSAGNTSVGVLTITGTATDQFSPKVVIVSSGIVGTSTFKYSLDGATNYSTELSTASTYAMPGTGITLNFGAGNYVAGDSFTFTTTMPGFTTSALNTALQALIDSGNQFDKVHVVGVAKGVSDSASASASIAIASALNSKIATLDSSLKYASGIVDGADIANTSTGDGYMISAVANTVAGNVMLCQGFAQIVSAVSGKILRRPVSWAISSLIRKLPYAKSPHAIVRGQLNVLSLERDEFVRPGLDAARITVARSVPGAIGYYICQPLMLTSPTSDFKYSYNKSILDRAKTYTVSAVSKYLNEQFPTNPNGTITQVARAVIENYISNSVGALLETEDAIVKGSFSATVDPTVNLATTETLKITIRFRVKGTAKYIVVDIGFSPTTKTA